MCDVRSHSGCILVVRQTQTFSLLKGYSADLLLHLHKVKETHLKRMVKFEAAVVETS